PRRPALRRRAADARPRPSPPDTTAAAAARRAHRRTRPGHRRPNPGPDRPTRSTRPDRPRADGAAGRTPPRHCRRRRDGHHPDRRHRHHTARPTRPGPSARRVEHTNPNPTDHCGSEETMTTISDAASGTTSGGYGLPNSAPEGPQRLDALAECLDPITIPFLEQTGVPVRGETGQAACLELGPGGGSILRWWLDTTAPAGTVTAVDLDPSRLRPTPGLTVANHDLTTGLPENLGGP